MKGSACTQHDKPSSQQWMPVGFITAGFFGGEHIDNLCCSAGVCAPVNYWLETGSFCCQAGQVERASSLGQCPTQNLGQQLHSGQGGFLIFYDFTSPGSYLISQLQYGSYSGVSKLLTNSGGIPTFLPPTGDDTQRWYMSRGFFPLGIDSFIGSQSQLTQTLSRRPIHHSAAQNAVSVLSAPSSTHLLKLRAHSAPTPRQT